MEGKTYYYWHGVAKKTKSASGGINFGIVAGSYGELVDRCAELFGADELGVTYFELTSVSENWLPWLQGEIVGNAMMAMGTEK